MVKIPMGKNIAFGTSNGNLPNMSGALLNWFLPITFEKVVKQDIGFQIVETTVPLQVLGVVQPLKSKDLILKPEGQRAWTWLLLFCLPNEQLNVDDVVLYLGQQTRVMALKNFDQYGYCEYHLVQDFTGAGPTVVTP